MAHFGSEQNDAGASCECRKSAADPLNLTGIVTPGTRVPALTNNRVLYRDGAPVGGGGTAAVPGPLLR